MLIHLESGACESGIDKVDLQDMIHSSQLSRRFVDDGEFLSGMSQEILHVVRGLPTC